MIAQYSFNATPAAQVINTNTQLGGAITTPGHYTLYIDLSAMASGDTVVITFLVQVASGGSFKTVSYNSLSGAQTNQPVFPIAAIAVPFQAQVFVNQTAGTGRVLPWTICRVDD